MWDLRFGLLILSLLAVFLLPACTSGSAQRAAYETVQSIHQQNCLKDQAGECLKRESYDDYQRKRKELE